MDLRERLREDLQPFVEAMLDELVRHHPEKGESYKLGAYQIDAQTRYSSMPPRYERVKVHEQLLNMLKGNMKLIEENPWSNQGEYTDHALYCFMLWWQLENKPTTYNHIWGFDENEEWIWKSTDCAEEKTEEK